MKWSNASVLDGEWASDWSTRRNNTGNREIGSKTDYRMCCRRQVRNS